MERVYHYRKRDELGRTEMDLINSLYANKRLNKKFFFYSFKHFHFSIFGFQVSISIVSNVVYIARIDLVNSRKLVRKILIYKMLLSTLSSLVRSEGLWMTTGL